MTAQYRILPAADRDLDERAAYLATQASLDTALRFYDAANSTFGNIARMPGIGGRLAIGQPPPCGPAYLAPSARYLPLRSCLLVSAPEGGDSQ